MAVLWLIMALGVYCYMYWYLCILVQVFNGVDAAFLPNEEKALLHVTVTKKFQELEAKYSIDN